jgi:hypothetical protein
MNMIKLRNEIREPTVQLSNEDLDKVSGGCVYTPDVQWPKAVAGEKSAAGNDALVRG